MPLAASIVLLMITTVLLWLVEARLQQDHLIFIYFLPTALIAIRYGSLSAMAVAIAGAFAAAFLLYPPRFSLAVESPLDILELILFSLLALLASQVVSGFAKDRHVLLRQRRVKGGPRWWSRAALRAWLRFGAG